MSTPRMGLLIARLLWMSAALLPMHGPAAESAEPAARPREPWIRRFGQLAKVLPERSEELTKLYKEDARDVNAILKRHHVRADQTFVKEITPGSPYAFRYREYEGEHLVRDLEQLNKDSRYRGWHQQLDECLASPWVDLEEVFYTAGRRRSQPGSPAKVHVFGQVVGLRPEMFEPYRLLHAHPWPGVLAKISEGNIRNYSIFVADLESRMYLFAYFEYVGSDFEKDMKLVDADPVTQSWMKFTDQVCQLPLETRSPGEWWATMEHLSSSTHSEQPHAD